MKDQLGIVCSGLCIVHCIATPVLLGLGASGLLTSMLSTEFVHLLLILPIALVLILTVPSAYKRYKKLSITVIAVIGMLFLIAALFLGEENEALFTIIGGSFLIVFHLWNLSLARRQKLNEKTVDVVSRVQGNIKSNTSIGEL